MKLNIDLVTWVVNVTPTIYLLKLI